MDYNFKKLSAVEQVSEMSDNANVLIEEDGKIKRVSKEQVGGGMQYDLIINASIIYDEDGNEVSTIEPIPDGTYEKLKNKLLNREPIHVHVFTEITEDGSTWLTDHTVHSIEIHINPENKIFIGTQGPWFFITPDDEIFYD